MYWQMLTESRNQTFREENYDAWGWWTGGDLLWYVKAGCDKPRFEVLVPQDSNTAGEIVAIRAIGGQSGPAIDPTLFNRVKVTHKDFHRLYHVTTWPRLESIYDIGLCPGGLVKDGRK